MKKPNHRSQDCRRIANQGLLFTAESLCPPGSSWEDAGDFAASGPISGFIFVFGSMEIF
jgi:hypothetical protein